MPKKKLENYVSRIKYTKEQIEEFNKNNPGKEIDKYGNIYTETIPKIPKKIRKYDISNVIGKSFGRLKVIAFVNRESSNKSKKLYLKCECLCKDINRNIIYTSIRELKTKRVVSCGCIQKEKASILSYENLIGKKFGELTVLEECKERTKDQLRLWKCKCSCGNIIYATTGSLKIGNTTSCGHLRYENALKSTTTHGMSKYNLYKIWIGIKQRCNSFTDSEYQFYGGRGIKVYEKWNNDFINFYNWAITSGYSEGLTIDRINVNGHYIPNNCRWVDMQTQSYNTRRSIRTIDGYSVSEFLAKVHFKLKNIRKFHPDINDITIYEFADRISCHPKKGTLYYAIPSISKMTSYVEDYDKCVKEYEDSLIANDPRFKLI